MNLPDSKHAGSSRLRVAELFCGVGGCAAALGDLVEIVAAVDISPRALETYRHNFSHPVAIKNLAFLPLRIAEGWAADLWWMSPPCQPYTRRGLGRDLEDPRSAALLHLIDLLESIRPASVALENVPDFRESRSRDLLVRVLERSGYEIVERLLCPSELGTPNRRRRYYLVASRTGLLAPEAPTSGGPPLSSFLDAEIQESLTIGEDLLAAYDGALDVVDGADPGAVTACFTSAYGRSPVRSGSYLRTDQGVRRFSPREILRLLGFPESFRLPPGLSPSLGWRLAGNSLSIPAVAAVLSTLPELRNLGPSEPALGELADVAS